jgi:hypothetical protein
MKIFAWIFSLYILVLSLAPNMQGGEYFKVYKLVGHYFSHQTSDNTYSDFLSFLNDHYLKKDHHEREHKELPFKNQAAQNIVIAYHQNGIEKIEVQEALLPTEAVKYFYKDPIPDQVRGSVWNPPKIV